MNDGPRVLGGRYQLGAVLGRGGMAEVRRATDRRLGREVAVKQLRIDLASDSTFQARFRREAQAAAGLNHPNIVAVYDTGEEPDPSSDVMVPYIVMELVEGHTLREILRTGRQVMPAKALEFTKGVLDALSYSHRAGIIHRDIKPANVMLTPAGQVKVMDFGIARAVADTSATMTQTAAVIGTAQYLSPEQARGEKVDARSDIYAAGCLLYELLTGRPPFQGDSPVSVAYQHVREAPVPPGELDPEITPAMDAITLKALAKNPADRYQSAAAMSSDISRYLAGQEVLARVPAPASTQVAAVATTSPTNPDTTVLPADTANRAYPPSPKGRWGLVAFLIALVLTAAGIGIYHLANANKVETVMVPWVVDRKQADAERELTDAKLSPRVVPVVGPDDQTVGRVIDQNPKNMEVPIGTEVVIQVNKGPTKGVIPPLEGLDKQGAIDLLIANNFSNYKVEQDPAAPNTAKTDEVTKVNPASGAEVPLDTEITIYVATGTTIMPPFRNLTRDEAINTAAAAGFLKEPTFTETESTAVPGTVISQDPPAGTTVKYSAKIKLVLAKAIPPPPVTTPPVTPPPDPEPEP